MTAVSVAAVTTLSNVGDFPSSAAPIVSAPSIGDCGGRVGGDQEEVLAGVGGLEPGVPALPDRQLGGALEAEVGDRLGVGQVVGDLAALEQHVERDHDRAGLEDAVVDDREVRQVRAAQRDLVARLDPALDEQVGDLVRGAVRPARRSAGCRRGRRPRGTGSGGRSPRAGSTGSTWRQPSAPRSGSGTPAGDGHDQQGDAQPGDRRADHGPLVLARHRAAPDDAQALQRPEHARRRS